MDKWLWILLLGIALGGSAGLTSLLASLALAGIWVPFEWWRTLAVAGAVLELSLMTGFFSSTKLLPAALNLAVLAGTFVYRLPVR